MKIKNMKLYMKNRREKRRLEILNILGNICGVCGETDISKLDIVHINPVNKTIKLSGKGLDGNWNKILEEVSGCQILCKTCHKQKTKQEGSHSGGHNKIQDVQCGMPVKYVRDGCRCDLCKKARNLNRKKLLGYSERIANNY